MQCGFSCKALRDTGLATPASQGEAEAGLKQEAEHLLKEYNLAPTQAALSHAAVGRWKCLSGEERTDNWKQD
jgi:hypothetical protein